MFLVLLFCIWRSSRSEQGDRLSILVFIFFFLVFHFIFSVSLLLVNTRRTYPIWRMGSFWEFYQMFHHYFLQLLTLSFLQACLCFIIISLQSEFSDVSIASDETSVTGAAN